VHNKKIYAVGYYASLHNGTVHNKNFMHHVIMHLKFLKKWKTPLGHWASVAQSFLVYWLFPEQTIRAWSFRVVTKLVFATICVRKRHFFTERGNMTSLNH
jgi:hypothetical protein